jgi:hypothetical protein
VRKRSSREVNPKTRCPHCGCFFSKVLDRRGQRIRRKCIGCKARNTSYEIAAEDLKLMVCLIRTLLGRTRPSPPTAKNPQHLVARTRRNRTTLLA